MLQRVLLHRPDLRLLDVAGVEVGGRETRVPGVALHGLDVGPSGDVLGDVGGPQRVDVRPADTSGGGVLLHQLLDRAVMGSWYLVRKSAGSALAGLARRYPLSARQAL